MKKKPAKRKAVTKKKTRKTAGSKVSQIAKLAKKTRKKGEKWITAIKRASKELKK